MCGWDITGELKNSTSKLIAITIAVFKDQELKYEYYVEAQNNSFTVPLNYENALSQYYITPNTYKIVISAVDQDWNTIAKIETFNIKSPKQCDILSNCGDNKLDTGEECDDGNNQNGDGCSSECKYEKGAPISRRPVCGNNVIEAWEDCEWGTNCTAECSFIDNKELEKIRQQICIINGNCETGKTSFVLPNTLPSTGPDEEYLLSQLGNNWHKIINNAAVDTSTIEWYYKMEPTDPNYTDPIYWIENILPKEFRKAESFVVLPSIGTVSPIEDIRNPSVVSSFLMGIAQGYQPYLNYGTVFYPNTAKPREIGNSTIFGHSSNIKSEENKIGNTFKLLPLIKRGDIYYIVQKNNNGYDVYPYEVSEKKIIKPEQTDVLRQDIKWHISTLMTCYPIGTLDERLVVIGQPLINIVENNINSIITSLTAREQIKLIQLSQKLLQQYNEENTSLELVIYKLQKARETLEWRKDISTATKTKRQHIWQYIIHQLLLQNSQK